jgi:hydrogenase-1 operon protein HyaF
MHTLKNIPIQAENSDESARSNNVTPILYEISHALEQLLADGGDTLIDLNTLPLTPADEQLLSDTLGRGEVDIRLYLNDGESRVWETGIPGVWRVEHHQADGTALSRHLEISHVPAIVMAQTQDMQAGLQHLSDFLAATPR